jgi:hypothetical protein
MGWRSFAADRAAGRAALAALCVLVPALARAEPVGTRRSPGPVAGCQFEGWSNDPDPAGLPVRYEPQPDSASLGRLPPPRVIGLDELAVLVKVTGYRDGWFRIDSAFFPGEADANYRPSAPAFRGTGWVPTAMVKATLGADALLVAPRRDARRKAALTGKRGGFPITPDTVAVKRLLSCSGTWVEVDTEFGIGWVERVCARQLGSC